MKEDQKDWDGKIPFLTMAYRSRWFTPSMLVFGHELRLPIDVILGVCPQSEKNKTQYVSSYRQNMNVAFEKVRSNLTISQKRQKDYFDKKNMWERNTGRR